jgi:hypothetical protein
MPIGRFRRPTDGEAAPDAEPEEVAGVPAAIPWTLNDLLRDGPAPLEPRPPRDPHGDLAVTLVLGPGHATPRAAGLPPELLKALQAEGIALQVIPAEDDEDHGAAADVLLAAGWTAAPAVLTTPGVRARAVLATPDEPPLGHLGWTDTTNIAVIGPSWMGADIALPPGADAAYAPKPVHRRDDLVLVHGEEPFGLLTAAELARRRPDDLAFAVTGVRADLALPFPFLGIDPGPDALAYAFASATVAVAPAVKGWRPAAIAMLACGQAVVAPGDEPTRRALQDAASYAGSPQQAADAVEQLLDDHELTLRADRVRAGFALAGHGWQLAAHELAAALRALL